MTHCWILSALCLATYCSASLGDDTHRYNFRSTPAYEQLSAEQQVKLEQVNRDLARLYEAVNRYASDHDGRAPKDLKTLVPQYLAALPRDPFATASSASERLGRGQRPSLGGWGYRYSPDAAYFVYVSSVGLPRFPYKGERNYGLYRAVLLQPSMRLPKRVQLIQEEKEILLPVR